MNPLKIGLPGYGVVGKRRWRCVDQQPYMNLVAVYDPVFSNSGAMDDGVLLIDVKIASCAVILSTVCLQTNKFKVCDYIDG